MGNHEDPLCKISMFLAGFIFFTPHRIAITCANHVVKRYHLPLGTVAMFVYRIHNLMELGSFAGTVVNTAIKLSTIALSEDNKTMLKNCVSGISIWLMFIWSIITYFSFMAGGEYGYFGEFFWNIVMLVFIYGVYSNSSMGIEGLNAPLYIVGLPLFGLFTFVFHKLYKYLYYIYFWDEYDYVLVLYQIWIMIILSFATSVVWTVARVMDSTSSSDVEIDASVTPTNTTDTNGANYGSGSNQFKVEKKDGNDPNVPQGYVRFDHKPKDNSSFKLGSVKHNDQVLNGIQSDDNVQAVYVYYHQTHDPNHEFPLIVCVEKSNGQTYYKRGQRWDTVTISKGPEDNQVADDLSPKLGDYIAQYEVKLEKDNTGEGKYKSSPQAAPNDKITVGPVIGTEYKGFKHSLPTTGQKINRITIHEQIVNVDTLAQDTPITDKQFVFVYFEKEDAERDRQKPLLICLSKDGTSGTGDDNKWYSRGIDYTWSNATADIGNTTDPNEIAKLATNLGQIKKALDKTNDPGYPKLDPNLSDTVKSNPDSGLAKLFGMDADVKEYHILHWSPIFLVALSLGTVYFFYPAISPYQLVDDPFDGKKIELWIQAISATPHIAFAVTELCKKGPGRLWTSYHYEKEGGNEKWYAIYHATWLFFIPYIICIYIFFSMMHFPDGRIGKYFRASVFRTGVLCVFFAWVQEFMEAVGFGGGMGAQVSGKCGDTFNDDAGTIFGFMFLVFMVFFMFTEDLYSKLFIIPCLHNNLSSPVIFDVHLPLDVHLRSNPTIYSILIVHSPWWLLLFTSPSSSRISLPGEQFR